MRTLSSRKKGLPSVRAISSRLSGARLGSFPEQGLQELVGARRRQRVKPQLGVVGLAAPAMLVLRPVVDQQQEPGGRQALDQAVEQGLGLGIDPVQVFKDQQQRLHLAFAQQQALEAVERALAPLRWIERQERTVRWQGVQEGEQRRDRRLQRLVQGEELPGHLGPDGAGVVTLLDMAIALEEVDDGEIRRRLAVRHRGAFEQQPALGAVGVAELIEQPRLAHAGLADHGHHLAVPSLRLLPGPAARSPARAAAPRSG